MFISFVEPEIAKWRMGKNDFGCRFDDDTYEPLALGKRNLVQL
jgi:hypothetical protein